ncbi:hypothetical protein GEMRC1_012370 [Eukaryota sp. GEM-RC1]
MLPPPAFHTPQQQMYPPQQQMPQPGMHAASGFQPMPQPGMHSASGFQPMGMQQMASHLSGFAQTMYQNQFAPSQQAMQNTQFKFYQIDTDRSGGIGWAEIKQAFGNSIDDAAIRMLLNLFDANRSGEIHMSEFVFLDHFIETIRQAYSNFSRGGPAISGFDFPQFIQAALPGIAAQVSPQTLQFAMSCFDKRRSNSINYPEAVKICVLIAATRHEFGKVANGGPSAMMNLDQLIRLVASTH